MADRDQHDVGLVIARLMLGAMFIVMGFYKLSDIESTAGWLADWDMPVPTALAWFAAIVETVGGLLLVAGVWPGPVALALALYLVPATLEFHSDLAAAHQITHLLKNTGLIGGLIAIWAARGGRIRLL